MESLAVHPDTPSPELARLLDLARYPWKAVGTVADISAVEPNDGWSGAIIELGDDPEAAWGVCRALQRHDSPVTRVLILLRGNQLDELDMRNELFTDFCINPFHPLELEARLRHLLWQRAIDPDHDLIEYGSLMLNPETYEAAIDGRTIDLTYMEYELLKFLASHPGKVFTREILLNRVWGYEYYGGARTVDVHVRRLRAKLGEEHTSLIQTVRSVGYRFGQSRWVA